MINLSKIKESDLKINRVTDSDNAIPTWKEVKSLVTVSSSNEGVYLLSDRTTLPAGTNLTSAQRSKVRGIGLHGNLFMPCGGGFTSIPTGINWTSAVSYCNSFNNGISGWHCPNIREIFQFGYSPLTYASWMNIIGSDFYLLTGGLSIWSNESYDSSNAWVVTVGAGYINNIFGMTKTEASASYGCIPVRTL